MKTLKKLGTLVLAMMMTFVIAQSVSAETYDWSAVKNPGSSSSSSNSVRLYVTTEELFFKATLLSGNCSYLAGKGVSTYPQKYYINNSARSVLISRVNGEQMFTMRFTNFDITKESYMYVTCTVEHNASIGETVYAKGIIYN